MVLSNGDIISGLMDEALAVGDRSKRQKVSGEEQSELILHDPRAPGVDFQHHRLSGYGVS